jgi:hypothetical protein
MVPTAASSSMRHHSIRGMGSGGAGSPPPPVIARGSLSSTQCHWQLLPAWPPEEGRTASGRTGGLRRRWWRKNSSPSSPRPATPRSVCGDGERWQIRVSCVREIAPRGISLPSSSAAWRSRHTTVVPPPRAHPWWFLLLSSTPMEVAATASGPRCGPLPCSLPPCRLAAAADAFEERANAIMHHLSPLKAEYLAVCLVCWRRFSTRTVATRVGLNLNIILFLS